MKEKKHDAIAITSTLISWTIIIKDYGIAVIMLTPHNGEIDPLEVHACSRRNYVRINISSFIHD